MEAYSGKKELVETAAPSSQNLSVLKTPELHGWIQASVYKIAFSGLLIFQPLSCSAKPNRLHKAYLGGQLTLHLLGTSNI